MELMAEALAVADLVGDRSMVARVLGNMSFLMARADNPILVDVFLEKSIDVAREAHDPLTMAVGLTNMSSGVIGSDAPRALSLLDEAVESTRRLGNVEWISLAHANRTLARVVMGEWDEVVAAPAFELIQPDHAAMVVVLAAMVLMARGQDPTPLLAAKGEKREQTGDYWLLGDVLALWHERDPSTGESIRQALDMAQEIYGISTSSTRWGSRSPSRPTTRSWSTGSRRSSTRRRLRRAPACAAIVRCSVRSTRPGTTPLWTRRSSSSPPSAATRSGGPRSTSRADRRRTPCGCGGAGATRTPARSSTPLARRTSRWAPRRGSRASTTP
jgi:hypothetical protein